MLAYRRSSRRAFLAVAAGGLLLATVGCQDHASGTHPVVDLLGLAPDAFAGAATAPARRAVRPTASMTVGFGDSIMAGIANPAPGACGPAWFNYLTVLSGQRIAGANAGIGGNTTGQMLARLDSDVLACHPSSVIVMGGTNDLPGDADGAREHMSAILDRLQAARVSVVLCTLPPRDGDAERAHQIAAYNNWLRACAAQRGLTLLDFYPVLIRPGTSAWRRGLSSDGTHPSSDGALLMAQHALSVLGPRLAAAPPYLTAREDDAANLLRDGLLVHAADRPPAGWSGCGARDARLSLVADEGGEAARWLRIARHGGGIYALGQALTGGLIAGERLALSGLIRIPSLRAGARYSMTLRFCRGRTIVGQAAPVAAWPVALAHGMVYAEATVPAGAESVVVQFVTAGPGDYRLARVGLVRLAAES